MDTEDLDPKNVISWEGRSKRERKPPPLTYWEEYVVTDQWYTDKLVEDVPEEEMYAALEDEDFEDDEGEEGDEEEEEEEDGREDILESDASYETSDTEPTDTAGDNSGTDEED